MYPIVRHYSIQPEDFTHAGQASANIKKLLQQLDYPPDAIRRVALAMYEGETNMLIHALGGEIRVEIFPDRIELLLEDQGPGIPDVDLALQKGYSTAPGEIRVLGFGAGMGLPNIQKYTDEMQVESVLGTGTRMYMTIFATQHID